MITVRHLTRKFGAKLAVDDLSFHLERGEVVGFLGPNGAGKTTTMRILAGYLPASSGAAEIDGLDVLRHSLAVRKSIGYLPESVPLYRELRVREMLDFQGRLHGLSRAERRTRVPAALERVGIVDRSESIVGTLSRGQRQRVGLAVALLPDPKVLILDEPTSGLDPLQRLEVRKLLAELANERTVLLSSHILSEVEAIAPRVIILKDGRIAADGRKEDLLKRLGGAAFVRFEAMVGLAANDVAAAVRAIKSLRGVQDVLDRGRLGIHHVFEVRCDEDLREDLGALALQKKWAVRELSWSRPTLEELFARIALELGELGAESAAATATVHAASSAAPVTVAKLGDARPASGAAVRFELPLTSAQASSAPVASTPPTSSGAAEGGDASRSAAKRSGAGEPPGARELGVAGAAPGYRPLNPFEKPAAPAKVVYNLNPFDQGAHRDLSKPKATAGGESSEPAQPVDPSAPKATSADGERGAVDPSRCERP
ncbi:MAG: ATP-binding cassette domain-containing protein [Planctomycetes bacterium]|nr:ATP-binding cassette domain-containing protein [Planctomycetota bacterium]